MHEGIVIIFVVLFSLALGSFLNVCIHRMPKGVSVVFPPSRCPACARPIAALDNIPIISFLLLKGRCRSCGGAISARYPLVEALTASIVTAIYLVFGASVQSLAYTILVSGLIIATFVDFEIHEIPDQVSLGGAAAGIVLSTVFPGLMGGSAWFDGLARSLVGVLAGGGSIYLMGFFGEIVFKREAMGGGDVKLMAMIGAFLGWRLALLTFFLAPLFGSVIGVIMKMRDGRDIIPYGPYLSLAALIAVFSGNRILEVLVYGL